LSSQPFTTCVGVTPRRGARAEWVCNKGGSQRPCGSTVDSRSASHTDSRRKARPCDKDSIGATAAFPLPTPRLSRARAAALHPRTPGRPLRLRDEELARDAPHCVEHPLVDDVARDRCAARTAAKKAVSGRSDVAARSCWLERHAPQFSRKRPGVREPQARLLAPVGASREPRYPRSVTEPAPPPACPDCSEPMQLATKSIRKRGLKPGQRVEPIGDEQRVRIWVCHRCGIQRRAQEQ